MAGLLRFIGLFNAAVWMGGSIFFSFLAGSVFFSPEVMRFTPPPYNGLVAQAMLERSFLLHYICGGIAIVHLFADWLEKSGTFPKKPILYVVVLLGLALLGGKWISPKLTIWHQQKYGFQVKTEAPPPMIEPKAYSNEVRQDAKLKLSIWHRVSQTVNLIMLMMLVWRFWRLSHPTTGQPQTYVETKRNLFSS